MVDFYFPNYMILIKLFGFSANKFINFKDNNFNLLKKQTLIQLLQKRFCQVNRKMMMVKAILCQPCHQFLTVYILQFNIHQCILISFMRNKAGLRLIICQVWQLVWKQYICWETSFSVKCDLQVKKVSAMYNTVVKTFMQSWKCSECCFKKRNLFILRR